jgi:16S rRNA processing protein RimM
MKKHEQQRSKGKNAQQPDSFLEVGRIIRPHGVRGMMVIASEAQYFASLPPKTTLYLDTSRTPYEVTRISRHQGRYLLSLQSVNTREEAETLRNTRVFLDMTDLPELKEDEYYYWQFIGLRVEDQQHRTLGIVKDILETGANDVYILETPSGKELLIPAIKDVVKTVDLNQGLIQINLLPGLIPDQDNL